MRLLLLLALAAHAPFAAAPGRIALGQYDGWGAFRAGDGTAAHCWAVAEPGGGKAEGDGPRPFVAVASWPARRIAGQLHVHLGDTRPARTVTVLLGGERLPLAAGPADAWARDAREDARIVAAMRRHDQLRIEVRSPYGRYHTDRYALTGAASAIDAAAVGCLR